MKEKIACMARPETHVPYVPPNFLVRRSRCYAMPESVGAS